MVKNMVKDSSTTDYAKTLTARLKVRTYQRVVGQWSMVNGHPGNRGCRGCRGCGHQASFALKL